MISQAILIFLGYSLIHVVLIGIEFVVIAIFKVLLESQRYLGVVNAVERLRLAGLFRLLHKVPDLKGERRGLLAIGHLGAKPSQAIVIVQYLITRAGCKWQQLISFKSLD